VNNLRWDVNQTVIAASDLFMNKIVLLRSGQKKHHLLVVNQPQ
jgi:hypothetical protein